MGKLKTAYDIKTFVMSLIGILSLAFAMQATGGTAFVLLLPITLFVLSGNKPEQLVFVLLLSISSILANGAVMPKNMIYGLTERGLFVGLGFILMTQAAGRKHPIYLTPILGILPYVAYMAIVSARGWCPIISYLKLFLFTSIFMGYYAIAVRSGHRELNTRKLRGMILAIVVFFVIGSVFAMRFGWAYMSREELISAPIDGNNLFKGMMSHSNALGGVLTAFSMILLTDMIFSIQKIDLLYIVNILIAIFFIARSGSRTAMGSFVLSACFAFYCMMKTNKIKKSWRSKVFSVVCLLIALCGIYLLVSASGRDHIARFITKTRDENREAIVTKENILSSRQGKIDDGIENWRESPMIGNGFQVSKAMIGFKANAFKDILSAPVEKSVWFSAVLEEGGVFGFVIFVSFLTFVFPTLIKRRAYIGATLLFSLFTGNFGEFTFFSLSGGGGMQWGMVFVGLILDGQRLKDENQATQVPQWNWY